MTKQERFALSNIKGAECRSSLVTLRHSCLFLLLGNVENAAALLAAHNLVSTFGVHRGRRRDFHVTSGTDTMLDRDHGGVTFTRK